MGYAEIKAKNDAMRAAGTLPGAKGTASVRLPLPVTRCRYVGESAGPVGWHYCDHPDTDNRQIPAGDIVCGTGCNGKCTPRCPGYSLPGPSVLITGGIGDAITVEGMLTSEERDRLETIYLAAPAAKEIEQLFRALPNYPRLKNHVTLPTGAKVLYSRTDVETTVGDSLPFGTRDLSIATVFPLKLPYTGSSLLSHRLTDVTPPQAPYVVIVPRSTWYDPTGRAFTQDDWKACLMTLDKYDLSGVVLCREKTPVPSHLRLLDMQGRTTITEAVELLKGAAGYLGIDSWASVLAAKLFSPNRVRVKCLPTSHGYSWRHVYYAPKTEFSFLVRTLDVPEWQDS